MTTFSPTPEAIILQLVKYKCAKERWLTNRCQCRKTGLLYTDLCSCSKNDKCENQPRGCDDDDESDIEDQEDDDAIIRYGKRP